MNANLSALLIFGGFVLLAYYLFVPLLPVLIALILAILFDPLVDFGQKRLRLSRTLAVTLNFLLLLGALGLALYIGAAKLVLEFYALIQWLFTQLPAIQHTLLELGLKAQILYATIPPEYADGLRQGVGSLTQGVSNSLSYLATALISLAAALPNLFVIGIIILASFFLFSLELPKLKYYLYCYFTPRAQGKLDIILSDLNKALIGFIRAQIIVSFLMYLIVAISLMILGVPYALALSLVIVVVDILPILGTGSVIVPWSVYAWWKGDPTLAVGLLILYLLTIVFRRVVEPKILGQSLGISTLATLLSMFIGFSLMGLLGLLFGPLVVIVAKSLRKAGILNIQIDW